MQETQFQSLGQENPLEKEMPTHSSTLVWKIPRTEEHGELQVHGITKSQTLLEWLHTHSLTPWTVSKGKNEKEIEPYFIQVDFNMSQSIWKIVHF